jgi:hypothetical protein
MCAQMEFFNYYNFDYINTLNFWARKVEFYLKSKKQNEAEKMGGASAATVLYIYPDIFYDVENSTKQ